MLSKFFINRPVFAAVISTLIVLLGAVSYTRLPVAQYPELAPPIVHVEAQYPGASAQVIANTVAIPIEEQVNGVDHMLYMNGACGNGLYTLDISFEPGTDVDLAAVLVQNRVNAAESRLPDEVRRQGVTTRKQSSAFVGVVSLYAPSGKFDDIFLANYLSLNIKDELLRIYGVGGAQVLPAKDYGMRIWLDPERLKVRNLTVNEVIAAIREQNAVVASGSLGREPAPANNAFELLVNTKGRLTSPEEFENIIVRVSSDRSVVRLKDVGRIELGTRDYSVSASFSGNPAAILLCYQLPGANLVEVAGKVSQRVHEFQALIDSGPYKGELFANFFYDSSMFITASLSEVYTTLGEAFALVFVVVLVFLQNLRTTLIPTLTIPVSLIGTFLLMQLFGFSINMLTMFGMVLAIGIVVDDAILVVENVERNMKVHRLGAKDATLRAMGEITGPIIAVTLVLMSVFIPAASLTGITGQMYRQFALTIAASTALSAVCALTLSPALCALLLKAHATDGKHHGFILFRPFAILGDLFNSVFDFVTRVYGGLVYYTGRAAAVMLLLLVGVLGLTSWLVAKVPTGFVPNEDLGFVVVAAQLPDGASLARSRQAIAKANEIVSATPGVQATVILSGFGLLNGNGPQYATLFAPLNAWDERAKKGQTVERIIGELQGKLEQVQDASFFVFSLPTINGLGNTSGVEMKILDKQAGGRDAMQTGITDTLGGVFAPPANDKIAFAFSGYRAGVPQIFLDVDREKVKKLGIPLSDVFDTLQGFLGSSYVNDYNQFNKTYQVTVQADAKFRLDPADIRRLEVRNRDGQMIPMATFLTVTDTFGPDRVERYQMYPSASVTAISKPGVSSGETMQAMENLTKQTLPPGFGAEWTNMALQEKRASEGVTLNLFGSTYTLTNAVLTFSLALILVYLILAAQYESLAAPIAVMLSVPLVIIGAFAFVLFRGLDNNIFTQIGLVLLVGLGAKNAILIVEFARHNRLQGKPIVESAVTAAKDRLRPILMTSFSFILGVTPLLFAQGAGAAGRRALGTAVFGGMLSQTVLGLLLTPALFVAVQWSAELIRPLRKNETAAPEAATATHA